MKMVLKENGHSYDLSLGYVENLFEGIDMFKMLALNSKSKNEQYLEEVKNREEELSRIYLVK